MTGAEWLSCEDPGRMLHYLETGGPARDSGRTLAGFPVKFSTPLPVLTDRKLRLFACAVERYRMDQHARKRKKRGRAGAADEWRLRGELLTQVEDLTDGAVSRRGFVAGFFGGNTPVEDARIACRINTDGLSPLSVKAALLHDIIGNPWRPVRITHEQGGNWIHAQTLAQRDVTGWFTWHDGAVPKLARHIYDGRDWAALPVLADALEEAGCPADEPCPECDGDGFHRYPDGRTVSDTAACLRCAGEGRVPNPLRAHLRGPGPHARGCWALDLILGKD